MDFRSLQKALAPTDTEKDDMYEAQIENYLVEQVQKHSGMCLKLIDAARRGFPDRTVIWPRTWSPALVHLVEVKTPDGVLASWQQRYHKELRDMGVDVFTLWTKEEVDGYVKGYAAASS
jgi:hypothetical protein